MQTELPVELYRFGWAIVRSLIGDSACANFYKGKQSR